MKLSHAGYWIPQAARYRAAISRQEQINARIEANERLAELQAMQERQAGIAVLAIESMEAIDEEIANLCFD
jgi:hypothetical protein